MYVGIQASEYVFLIITIECQIAIAHTHITETVLSRDPGVTCNTKTFKTVAPLGVAFHGNTYSMIAFTTMA